MRNHSTEYSRADIHGPDPVAMAREWSSGAYADGRGSWGDRDEAFACVWEIYSRKDGLVYVICDGYDDFLREPASPEIYNERFYPWYALVFNEVENEHELFPPSDVRLIRDMQMEYNRCREALKEHRIAARPFIGVVGGSLDEEELDEALEPRGERDRRAQRAAAQPGHQAAAAGLRGRRHRSEPVRGEPGLRGHPAHHRHPGGEPGRHLRRDRNAGADRRRLAADLDGVEHR